MFVLFRFKILLTTFFAFILMTPFSALAEDQNKGFSQLEFDGSKPQTSTVVEKKQTKVDQILKILNAQEQRKSLAQEGEEDPESGAPTVINNSSQRTTSNKQPSHTTPNKKRRNLNQLGF